MKPPRLLLSPILFFPRPRSWAPRGEGSPVSAPCSACFLPVFPLEANGDFLPWPEPWTVKDLDLQNLPEAATEGGAARTPAIFLVPLDLSLFLRPGRCRSHRWAPREPVLGPCTSVPGGSGRVSPGARHLEAQPFHGSSPWMVCHRPRGRRGASLLRSLASGDGARPGRCRGGLTPVHPVPAAPSRHPGRGQPPSRVSGSGVYGGRNVCLSQSQLCGCSDPCAGPRAPGGGRKGGFHGGRWAES